MLQPKEMMSGMKDIPQAHEKAQKFEIAALFPNHKIEQSD